MKVAVIGAGVTGLATAYELARRGVDVEVFEARDREGGLAGTFRRDGFSFDYGPHEYCTSHPELIELLHEVCGEDLLVVDKRTAQYLGRRLIPYPFEVSALASVRPLLALKVLGEILGGRIRRLFRRDVDRSFADWTRARFGRTLYETYFGPYTEKVWGVDPERLDAQTAAERISVASLRELVFKTLAPRTARRRRTHDEFPREFFYFRGGTGALQRHLKNGVERHGGRLHFGRRLQGIERTADRVTGLLFEDGTGVNGFSHVVMTIPLSMTVRMALEERAPAILQRHPVHYRGMVFVFVRAARGPITDRHWIYFPERSIPFQRLTEFLHFGADMCPEGTTGVTLEVSATQGDGTWRQSDDQIAAGCLSALAELGFLESKDVLGYDVVRTAYAYPLQLQGYRDSRRALIEALGSLTNLVTLGRQGLFRYCNQDECMEMALDVVPRIVAGETCIRYRGESAWIGAGVPSP